MEYTGLRAREGFWKIIPISFPLISVISFSLNPRRFLPLNSTVPLTPDSGGKRRIIACAATDLPHPVSPTRASVSLSPIEKEIPERAVTVFIPKNETWRFFTSSSLSLVGDFIQHPLRLLHIPLF